MTDLLVLVVFLLGAGFGVIATVIFWPWIDEDRYLPGAPEQDLPSGPPPEEE